MTDKIEPMTLDEIRAKYAAHMTLYPSISQTAWEFQAIAALLEMVDGKVTE